MSREHCRAAGEILEKVTPLKTDCGAVCGGACCRGCDPEHQASGMRLFPGEAAADGFTVRETPHGLLLLCGGHCVREDRPLACRLFPLFPYLGEDGRLRAVYDPRAYRICPLVRLRERVPLDRDFVRAVRRAGRILAADESLRTYLREQAREIDEFNRFLRLDVGRPPVARRRQKAGR